MAWHKYAEDLAAGLDGDDDANMRAENAMDLACERLAKARRAHDRRKYPART